MAQSNKEIKKINIQDKNWNLFVDENKQIGSLFLKSTWLIPIKKIFGKEINVFGCYLNDQLIGGVALLVQKKGIFKIAFVPIATPYNSLIIKSNLEKQNEVLSELLEFIQREYDLITINLSPIFKDARLFQWLDFNCSPRYNYFHDLEKHRDENLPKNYSLRNKINKAKRNGIKIEQNNDFQLFWSLYEKTFKKQKFLPPFSKEKFLNLTKEYDNSGLIRMFLAKTQKGEPIAARIEVEDKPFIYDWLAGANPALLNSGGNQLLMWEILNYYSKQEFKNFDFCGADIPSVASFKGSFGGDLVQYFQIKKYCSWKIKIYKANKDFFSGLFRLWK
jgi:lipid II:glycine glycyltransferase (peptidoglycan interpeptide bridge formation enzyme)